MAYTTITQKVLGSDNYAEKKILASDINEIRQAIQTGELDLKPYNIAMEGNEITADAGQNWIRRSGNKFQFYDAGTWKEPATVQTASFTAGEDLAVNDVIYLNTTDGKVYKASETNNDWVGVVKTATTTGNSVETYLNGAVVGGFSGLTTGEWYGLTTTIGSIIQTDNNIVGIAINDTQIKLIKSKIDEDYTNNIYYAILYNRMENDQSGQTHLNNCIISDIFSDNNGCYDTICTTDTTSIYDNTNKYYANNISTNQSNQFVYTLCCIINNGCSYGTYANVATEYCTINYRCITNYPCAQTEQCMTLCLSDYQCIYISGTVCGIMVWANGSICGYSRINYGISTPFVSINYNCNLYQYQSHYCGRSISYTGTIELKYNDTNWDVYCNGVCKCNVDDCLMTIQHNKLISSCVLYGDYSCSYIFTCISHIAPTVITYASQSKKIATNLQKYDSLKKQVYITTKSNIPPGNCLTYNIVDNCGNYLLCGANINKSYYLSQPTNCMYVEFCQCVDYTKSRKQSLSQYAVMFT